MLTDSSRQFKYFIFQDFSHFNFLYLLAYKPPVGLKEHTKNKLVEFSEPFPSYALNNSHFSLNGFLNTIHNFFTGSTAIQFLI